MWGLKFSGEERVGRMMKSGRVGRTCVCGKADMFADEDEAERVRVEVGGKRVDG